MNKSNRFTDFSGILRRRPDAYAIIEGSSDYPDITGSVRFYTTERGTIVVSVIQGLPKTAEPCNYPIYAMHIHEGKDCSGNTQDSFTNAGTHYNPEDCPHPYHAGDLPPVFNAVGFAFGAVLTDRFSIDDIVGRTVILHSAPDDFTTQPSGNAGKKIACGEIMPRYSR